MNFGFGKSLDSGPLSLVFDDISGHIRDQLGHHDLHSKEQVLRQHENQHSFEEGTSGFAVKDVLDRRSVAKLSIFLFAFGREEQNRDVDRD